MTAAQPKPTRTETPPRSEPTEIVTRTARMWLDPDGIIREIDIPGSEHVLEDARENLAAKVSVSSGIRRPLLVDMSRVKSISREARAYYSGEGPKAVTAVALVVGSPLSRMIGNFFLGLNRAEIPIRLFSSIEDAAAWLRKFVAPSACSTSKGAAS